MIRHKVLLIQLNLLLMIALIASVKIVNELKIVFSIPDLTQMLTLTLVKDFIDILRCHGLSPRGGYCHIWAIWVCAAVKGMVFKQFTLG